MNSVQDVCQKMSSKSATGKFLLMVAVASSVREQSVPVTDSILVKGRKAVMILDRCAIM